MVSVGKVEVELIVVVRVATGEDDAGFTGAPTGLQRHSVVVRLNAFG